MPTTLHENRPSAGIGVVEVQKPCFFAISAALARPSACILRRDPPVPGAGAPNNKIAKTLSFCTSTTPIPAEGCASTVEIAKNLEFLHLDHADPRRGLRGHRRNCKKKPWVFAPRPRRSPQRVARASKNHGFLHLDHADPRRGSRGHVGNRKNHGFLHLDHADPRRGPRGNFRNRKKPWGFAPRHLHFKAACAEQLAQSKLHRATCADQLAPTSLRRAPCLEQLAQSNLRRATCTEQLAQSSLHRATCRERNLHRGTCREPLAGTNLPEQLARSNLRRASATCVEQLAQTNLHRPVCAEHLAWCCLALASRMLRVGKKNASCSVGPTSLAMFCFRANRGLVQGRKKATVGSKVHFSNKPVAWRQVVGNQLCGQANPRTVSAKQSAAANKPVVKGCFNSLVSLERGATLSL